MMAHKSPLTFWSLPREIRDEIYSYVLLTKCDLFIEKEPPISESLSYGFKCLDYSSNWYTDAIIDLSVLRTCKRIHIEAMDHLFRVNTVQDVLFYSKLAHFKSNHTRSASRIQHLEISDLSYGKHTTVNLMDILRCLETDWIGFADLKSVAIEFMMAEVWCQCKLLPPILHLLELWVKEKDATVHGEKSFANLLVGLKQLFANEHRNGIKRTLRISMDGIHETRVQDANQMTRKLHDAFGGELWVHREKIWALCYRDGKELSPPFDIKRADEKCAFA